MGNCHQHPHRYRYLQSATTCRSIAVTVGGRVRCTLGCILLLAPYMFVHARPSETLTSSSGTVCVRPGTFQRDTHFFLWHRVCSSRHITARHSPLPLSPCVFIQAHHSETHLFLWHRVCSSRHITARHTSSSGTVCVHPVTSQRDTHFFHSQHLVPQHITFYVVQRTEGF
jgi:hypothetical protein